MEAVFAYLRVSGSAQKDGDGFIRQITEIEGYAKKASLKVTQVFKEVVSGTTLPADRPVFMAMMAGLLSNGVKTVLIEKMDRLARDLFVQETILGDFQKRGLKVVSVLEPDLCSTDPSRIFIRQVFGGVAQLEKNNLVLKLRAARKRMKEANGRCEGRKPYGEWKGEAKILQRIRELAKRPKYTANRIATELNADGTKTRSGGLWYGSNVLRILRREGLRK
jgi:site-specific DNA recombinase